MISDMNLVIEVKLTTTLKTKIMSSFQDYVFQFSLYHFSRSCNSERAITGANIHLGCFTEANIWKAKENEESKLIATCEPKGGHALGKQD